MESRHDSENAERILYNMNAKQLVRMIYSSTLNKCIENTKQYNFTIAFVFNICFSVNTWKTWPDIVWYSVSGCTIVQFYHSLIYLTHACTVYVCCYVSCKITHFVTILNNLQCIFIIQHLLELRYKNCQYMYFNYISFKLRMKLQLLRKRCIKWIDFPGFSLVKFDYWKKAYIVKVD